MNFLTGFCSQGNHDAEFGEVVTNVEYVMKLVVGACGRLGEIDQIDLHAKMRHQSHDE